MAFRYTQKQRYIQPSYRKDTTYSTSGDYLDYISNLEDVPRYPSVNDEAYRNDIGSDYEDTDGTIHIEHHHQNHNHVPESHHTRPQRVRFMDSVEPPVDGERRGIKPPKEKGGAIMSVDDEADNFIKANHRGFEIRRWNTFTM